MTRLETDLLDLLKEDCRISLEKLSVMMHSSEAASMLGRTVELDVGDTTTSGVVEAVSRGQTPQVQVGGMFYDMNKIKTVYGY